MEDSHPFPSQAGRRDTMTNSSRAQGMPALFHLLRCRAHDGKVAWRDMLVNILPGKISGYAIPILSLPFPSRHCGRYP